MRQAGDVLGGAAVVLGVAAGVGGADTLSAWVPVVTTVAASLTAHIAASRYDHQIVEFLRAAQQLELLDVKRRRQELTNAEFIDACESGSSQLMGQAG